MFKGPSYVWGGKFAVQKEDIDQDKILFRMAAAEMIPKHDLVLDLFAGKGYLSWLYATYLKPRKIICIEKDPEIYKILRKNMRGVRNVITLNMDNIRVLEEPLWPGRYTLVDFDDTGCPTAQIIRFFKAYPITHALIISITDGMILNFRSSRSADLLKWYLQDFYPEASSKMKDLLNPYEINTRLGEYFPEIQRRFIDILCMRHNAQAVPLYFKIKKTNTVMYSSYMILPRIPGLADYKKYAGLKAVK